MNRTDIRRLFAQALGAIAPEVELDTVPESAPLREELDIDSFDFLRLLGTLEQQLKLRIPETDYARVDTLAHLLDYLEERTAQPQPAQPA